MKLRVCIIGDGDFLSLEPRAVNPNFEAEATKIIMEKLKAAGIVYGEASMHTDSANHCTVYIQEAEETTASEPTRGEQDERV